MHATVLQISVFALRALLVLMSALLLWQSMQLASALWQLKADAFVVSSYLLGALLLKGALWLVNLGGVAWLWRLSGLCRGKAV